MPRNLTAATLAELTASSLRPVLFVQIQFTSQTSYIWSGRGNITWNGQQWIGIGDFGAISAMTESSEIAAQGLTLSLSGIDPDMLGHALNEVRQNYPVKIWFGAISTANPAIDNAPVVVADPWQAFSGRIDVPTVDEGGDTSTISITVESRLIDLNRSRERRYTDADQQSEFPGDLGFSYVPALQDWTGTWGKSDGSGIKRIPGGGSKSSPTPPTGGSGAGPGNGRGLPGPSGL